MEVFEDELSQLKEYWSSGQRRELMKRFLTKCMGEAHRGITIEDAQSVIDVMDRELIPESTVPTTRNRNMTK